MYRLLHTEPFEKLAARTAKETAKFYGVGQAHVFLVKSAGAPETVHSLAGELYYSKSGWLLLNVPNALVRGAFDALNEHGAELPPQHNGNLNAHITVMRPEEIESIGGPDKITERGHVFHYTLGPLQVVTPDGWDGMSRAWFIQVKSKELQDLRKSYGLTPKPKENKHDFHITIAVRRKKILQHNEVSKAANAKALLAAALFANEVRDNRPKIAEEDEEQALAAGLAEQDQELEAIRAANPVAAPTPIKAAEDATLDVPVPDTDQETKFDCGPAALKAIMDYYGEKDDLTDMREAADADPEGGTTPEKLVELAKAHGMNVRAQHGMTVDTLRSNLDLKRPVIVNMQAWGDDDLYKEDRAGHYVVIIGYDDKNFYFEDPAIKSGDRAALSFEEFDRRWHDVSKDGTPTDHLGIVVWRDTPPEEVSAEDDVTKLAWRDDPEEDEDDLDWKKWLLPGGVAAGAGLGASYLHKPTATDMPAQVTRFPTKSVPSFIRGRVSPNNKASTIEGSNDAYMVVGAPGQRAHIQAEGLEDMMKGMRERLRPGQRVGMLELHGHGSPAHQDIGAATSGGVSHINRGNAADVAKNLACHVGPGSSVLLGGCNTGLATEDQAFGKTLADRSGADVLAARGYSVMPDRRLLDIEVHRHGGTDPATGRPRGPQYTRESEDPYVKPVRHMLGGPGEDRAYTVYSPGKAPAIHRDPVDKTTDDNSKSTWFNMPGGALGELAYNVGKPSAIAGGLLAPLLSNEGAARGTALGTTAMAAPMAISEILARAAESRAKDHYKPGTGDFWGNQLKALPYVGLASLPMMSYGLAKLLGRWKEDKKKKRHEQL